MPVPQPNQRSTSSELTSIIYILLGFRDVALFQ